MAHGDNRGLKLPPLVAPIQAVIVPIAQQKDGVLDEANKLKNRLNERIRIKLDDRDNYSVGYKFNEWEMKGVPIRIEIGPKDIEKREAILVRRDTSEKIQVKLEDIETKIDEMLKNIQVNMFNICKKRMEEKTTIATNIEELKKNLEENQGFVKSMWCGNQECEDKVKEITGAPSRCIPFEQEHLSDVCVCCGRPAKTMIVWGRQY